MVTALMLSCSATVLSQAVPADWKVIRDARSMCQIAVPPDWDVFGEVSGAAVFHDPTTAIAVVTSQPGQEYKPLTGWLLKSIGVPKELMFENSATRIFYQDKVSRGAEDTSAFSSSVPAKRGTCSCRVVVVPRVGEELAKKIVLSLSSVAEKN